METFEYCVPLSIEEALDMLSGDGKRRPLMGGTDLVIQLEEKVVQADVLVDLSKIPALHVLGEDGGTMTIGAAVTHAELCAYTNGLPWYKALYDAAISVGTPQVRNIATIVGNICNAVPSADLGAPILLHDSVVHIAGKRTRTLPAAAFFTGPRRTVLEPGEFVTHLTLPACKKGIGKYVKFSPRKASDLATVGVAVYLALDEVGLVEDLRVAVGAVAPTPIRIMLPGYIGRPFTVQIAAECASIAAEACAPITDFRASAEYRRHIVGVYTERLLNQCSEEWMREKQ